MLFHSRTSALLHLVVNDTEDDDGLAVDQIAKKIAAKSMHLSRNSNEHETRITLDIALPSVSSLLVGLLRISTNLTTLLLVP